MSKTQPSPAPVVKQRIVPLDQRQAFELFTRRMGEWWPTAAGFSIAGASVVAVRFEEKVGGRVLEVTRDGEELEWAEVLEWDPPARFVLAWHPDRARAPSSRLEVEFVAGEEGTQVRLTHTGWEVFGDRAAEVRANYEGGWEMVLRPFEALSRASG